MAGMRRTWLVTVAAHVGYVRCDGRWRHLREAGGASSIDRQKVLEEAGTDGRGALGVELGAVEIAPLHAGAEGRAVAGARNGGGAEVERVAMHEIRVVAVGQTLEKRAWT